MQFYAPKASQRARPSLSRTGSDLELLWFLRRTQSDPGPGPVSMSDPFRPWTESGFQADAVGLRQLPLPVPRRKRSEESGSSSCRSCGDPRGTSARRGVLRRRESSGRRGLVRYDVCFLPRARARAVPGRLGSVFLHE